MSQFTLTLEQENALKTGVVLANAGELATAIVGQIAGNDISTAINGAKATNEIVQSLLYQRIVKRVQSRQSA
jgi:hypothetical protein